MGARRQKRTQTKLAKITAYVSQEVADHWRREAEAAGMSISSECARILSLVAHGRARVVLVDHNDALCPVASHNGAPAPRSGACAPFIRSGQVMVDEKTTSPPGAMQFQAARILRAKREEEVGPLNNPDAWEARVAGRLTEERARQVLESPKPAGQQAGQGHIDPGILDAALVIANSAQREEQPKRAGLICEFAVQLQEGRPLSEAQRSIARSNAESYWSWFKPTQGYNMPPVKLSPEEERVKKACDLLMRHGLAQGKAPPQPDRMPSRHPDLPPDVQAAVAPLCASPTQEQPR